MSQVLGWDDGDEAEPDEAAWAAYRRWQDRRDRGEHIDLDALTAGLAPEQRAQFFELIGDRTGLERQIQVAFGQPGHHAALGVAGRYILADDPAYPPRPGGMGCVYLARDRELDRDVAYKVSHDAPTDDEFRRRFAREARITAGLRYPGIVPIFGMVTDGSGRPAYAMEYVAGVTFRAVVAADHSIAADPNPAEDATPALPLRDRLRQFVAACRIVDHAHQQGVIHGDLSLKNLMLAQGGAVYVVDWGLARRLHEPDPDPRSGTPGYLPPSVREGRRPKSPATDVYSLGAILAALASGIDDRKAPRLDGTGRAVPRALRAIIAEATADRPDGQELYPNAGTLADDVERHLEGAKVQADHHEPISERALRWSRRYPRTATSTVAGLILIATIITWVRDSQARAAIAAAQIQDAQTKQVDAQAKQAVAVAQSDRDRYKARISRAAAVIKDGDWVLELFSNRDSANEIEKLLSIGGGIGQLLFGSEFAEKLRRTAQEARQENVVMAAERQQIREKNLHIAISTLKAFIQDYPESRFGRLWLAHCNNSLVVLELFRRVSSNPQLVGIRAYRHLYGQVQPVTEIEVYSALVDQMLADLPRQPDESITSEQIEFVRNDLLLTKSGVCMCSGKFAESVQIIKQMTKSSHSQVEGIAKFFVLAGRIGAEAQLQNLPWSWGPQVDHGYATRMAQFLVSDAQVAPTVRFDAARVFALAGQDEKASGPERERRVRRALELLQQVEASGYLRSGEGAKRLASDKELRLLSHRPEFQALVERATAPQRSGGPEAAPPPGRGGAAGR